MSRLRMLLVMGITLCLLAGLVFAQDDDDDDSTPPLQLTISKRSCDLDFIDSQITEIDTETTDRPSRTATPATPVVDLGILPTPGASTDTPQNSASTPPPRTFSTDFPVMVLGDDCEEVIPRLRMLDHETLWLSVSTADEVGWLTLLPVEDDPFPPHLDERGRYFGCILPEAGEQTCYVLVEWHENTVLLAIPVRVEAAATAPAVAAIPPAQATANPQQPPVPTSAPPSNNPTRPSLPLPNIAPNYAGGSPAGNYINWVQGDHAVRLYPLIDGAGNRFLHVYRIVGDEGWHIMSIGQEEIAPFMTPLPSEPLLLKYENGPGRYGPAMLFLLPSGALQFNIGPDDEDRVQVLIFSGPGATSLLNYYVYVVPGGWTGPRPGTPN